MRQEALQRQVFVANRAKSMNESIYYTIDLLHTAISTDEQVRFQIAEWTPEKTVRYRRGGKLYTVSPYALLWEDENYYLLAYDSGAGEMRHYRADRLAHLALAGGPRLGKEVFAGLDMAAYTKRTFGMFGGEETGVTLEFAGHLAGVVIDRFGKDVTFLPAQNGRFCAHVHVVPSVQFMGWLAGLGAEGAALSRRPKCKRPSARTAAGFWSNTARTNKVQFMGHLTAEPESTETKTACITKRRAGMEGCAFGTGVKMAAMAPKGVFEDGKEVAAVSYREEPYERHYDDFSRNWEEAA